MSKENGKNHRFPSIRGDREENTFPLGITSHSKAQISKRPLLLQVLAQEAAGMREIRLFRHSPAGKPPGFWKTRRNRHLSPAKRDPLQITVLSPHLLLQILSEQLRLFLCLNGICCSDGAIEMEGRFLFYTHNTCHAVRQTAYTTFFLLMSTISSTWFIIMVYLFICFFVWEKEECGKV